MTTTPETLEHIVVGTSLSEASDTVVHAALALRRATGARLALVHGFPLPVVYGGGIYGGAAVTQQIDADRKRYLLLVDDQLERVGATRADFDSVHVEVEVGSRLLDDVAETVDADLLVVGSHEGPKALEPLLGSTADRLLRRSRRPVLVVRHPLESVRRVVLPVDLSTLSETSARVGLGLVDTFTDAPYRVDAAFVLSHAEREGSVHFGPEQVDRFAREELDTFVERLGRDGVVPTVLHGDPRHEILDFLDTAGDAIDLVVLGTHGRSGFERFLLGSVSSELLRRLERNALVVPPPAGSDEDEAGTVGSSTEGSNDA